MLPDVIHNDFLFFRGACLEGASSYFFGKRENWSSSRSRGALVLFVPYQPIVLLYEVGKFFEKVIDCRQPRRVPAVGGPESGGRPVRFPFVNALPTGDALSVGGVAVAMSLNINAFNTLPWSCINLGSTLVSPGADLPSSHSRRLSDGQDRHQSRLPRRMASAGDVVRMLSLCHRDRFWGRPCGTSATTGCCAPTSPKASAQSATLTTRVS